MKARVFGSTSALVALAGTDKHSKRFARAMTSLENSENAMHRQHWKGELSTRQLLSRTHQLAEMRLKLEPRSDPVPLVHMMDALLTVCRNRQPLGMDDAVSPVRSLQVLLGPESRAARACHALGTAYWKGELNDFERFRAAFNLATQGDRRDRDRAAALHRAAVNALHDRKPEVGQLREVKRLESFIERLMPVTSGHERMPSIDGSRVFRADGAGSSLWWETPMFE